MTAAADLPVLHGYTLADLDRLAGQAVWNNRQWWPAGDRAGYHAAAWEGIAEALCAAAAAPAERDLLTAGTAAIAAEVRADLRHRGLRRDSGSTGAGFARYWTWHALPIAAPEEHVCDTVALTQILAALTPRQRDAVAALAAAGDYAAAARIAGLAPSAFRVLLSAGRRRFLRLWHEGEQPSRPWRCDRRTGRRETSDPDELAARAAYAAQARGRRARARTAAAGAAR